MTASTASEEWRRFGYLPLVAALGYTSAGLQLYAIGPFMEPLQTEFGWDRAQVSLGITIANAGCALLNVFMGLLIDRLGPRVVGISGVFLISAAIALLGTATGTTFNWVILWALIAVGAACIQPTAWSSAVASRFEASRGLALGVTLCGVSASAFILPILSTWLITHYDWRTAFFGLGAIWAVVLLPVLFLFFRGSKDAPRKRREAPKGVSAQFEGLPAREALRTSAFYKLLVAGGFFSFTLIGIIVHLVPILKDGGTGATTAAYVASLVGLFAIIGRLSTGFLLDRLPGHLVGAGSFLLPTLGCALLLWNGAGTPGHALAAALLGLSLGSELDALTFLTMRYFGRRNFGKIYGLLLVAVSVGTAAGPLASGAAFDHFRDYAVFLALAIACMVISAVALFSLRGTPAFRTEPLAAMTA
jgi:MFS family permease